MATLSQYIAQIRQQREQQTAQRLQGLIPLLQQKRLLEKEEEQKAEQRASTMSFLKQNALKTGTMDENAWSQFEASTGDIGTENLGRYYDTVAATNTIRTELERLNVPTDENENLVSMTGKLETAKQATALGEEGNQVYLEGINQGKSPEIALSDAKAAIAIKQAEGKLAEWKWKEDYKATQNVEIARQKEAIKATAGSTQTAGKGGTYFPKYNKNIDIGKYTPYVDPQHMRVYIMAEGYGKNKVEYINVIVTEDGRVWAKDTHKLLITDNLIPIESVSDATITQAVNRYGKLGSQANVKKYTPPAAGASNTSTSTKKKPAGDTNLPPGVYEE